MTLSEAKEYLQSIGVHLFRDLDNMGEDEVFFLVELNKAQGLSSEDIQEVIFPDDE
jgi:hypothetical protein